MRAAPGDRAVVVCSTICVHLMVAVGPIVGQPVGTLGGGWRLDSVPAVVMGTEKSGLPFSNVASAVRLSDGRFVVADGGLSSIIAVFSSDGQLVRQVGRTGDGPGEFRWITSLDVGAEDSVFVFDQALQRLTVLAPDGSARRTVPFRVTRGGRGKGGLSVVTRLAGGTWVGRGAEPMVQGPVGKLVRDTVEVSLFDGELTFLGTVALVPGRMTTTTMLDGRPVFRVPAFTPEALTATWGNCVFVSGGEQPVVMVYRSDGRLVATISGPGAPRPVSRAHLQTRLDSDLLEYGREREASLRTLIFSEAHPKHLPHFHRIVLDHRGNIWLQEYAPPWGESRRWYVLSQRGEVLATVLTPRSMTVFSIAEEGMLARTMGGHGEHLVEWIPFLSRPSAVPPPLPQCVGPGSRG